MPEPLNRKGVLMSTVNFLALAGGADDCGLLGENSRQRWTDIGKELALRWRRDEGQRALCARLSGCLDKLSASLLQIARLRDYHDSLLRTARHRPAPNCDYLALRAAPACGDFEGLLLHGRACLDRLTWFVASRFGQQCNSFRRLANVLANFEKDPHAVALLGIVRKVQHWTDAVYAKIDAPDALRDMVGHREALTERMRTCFGVQWLNDQEVLLIDCEIQMSELSDPIPILRTSADSAQYLAFTVLDCASLFLGSIPLGLDQYRCQWSPVTIPLSRYVVQEPDGAPLGPNAVRFARRMTPDGFVVETRNMDPRTRTHAVSLTEPVA